MNKFEFQQKLCIWMGLLLLFVSQVVAAEVTAKLSRNHVALNESVELVFESDQTLDEEPDFTSLEENFEVASRNKSQSIQVINGDMARKITWHLMLMPKQTGELEIPAIQFGSDRSQAIKLKVKAAQKPNLADGTQPLFVKMEVSQKQVYVQQQILLKVQLYSSVGIGDANLTAPNLEGGEVVIKPLGDDANFETRRNGVRYQVIERHYLVYPQKSGSLTIPGVTFQGEVFTSNRGQRDIFGRFRQRGELKRLRSNTVQIDILPIPNQFKASSWLPSSNLVLAEAWPTDPPKFVAGEPVTRTLMVMADGIPASQLPALNRDLGSTVKQYPDQPLLQDKESAGGVTGIRQEKVAIIPTQAGSFELPAIELTWWNTDKNQLETARIEARTIEVEANPSARIVAPIEPMVSVNKGEVNVPQVALDAKPSTGETGYSIWLIALLGGGWLGTVLAWWLSARSETKVKTPSQPKRPRGRSVSVELRQACQINDLTGASVELIKWAKHKWPESPPLSLGAIINRVEGTALANELRLLEEGCYSSTAKVWSGIELLSLLRQFDKTKSDGIGVEAALAPLNPPG